MDVYQIVTDRIIAELENGNIPWRKPWVGVQDVAYNRVRTTGKKGEKKARPYSLLNQLLLGKPGEWASAKQWEECGAAVKPGEKSSIVVFWTFIPKKGEDGKPMMDDDGHPYKIPMLKYYSVFHIDQVEKCRFEEVELTNHKTGEKYKKKIPKERTGEPMEPVIPEAIMPHGVTANDLAEAALADYVEREGIDFVHDKQNHSCYIPALDQILLPNLEQFKSTAEYYSTAFHEATHSTGAKKRLDRLESCHFGSGPYAKEELVAELGAAMLCNRFGLESESSMQNSVAYIQNWLKALKDDKRLIVGAASKAEKAVDFILNIKAMQEEDHNGEVA